jgi:hypothetical protein
MERSAVTPQLPIMSVGDDGRFGLDEWAGDREERMQSVHCP